MSRGERDSVPTLILSLLCSRSSWACRRMSRS